MMIKAGIKEARQHFTKYLAKVEKGEEIIITKREEPIARIIPVRKAAKGKLSSHKGLRESLGIIGKPLSEIVIESRREDIY